MTKLELAFRQTLIREMNPYWTSTIHVENHLNPGVPDMSYVMRSPGCETGWLELKAIVFNERMSIQVERSQHQWMRDHARRVPAHFLINIGLECFLVDGRYNTIFTEMLTLEDLASRSIAVFSLKKMTTTLPKVLTQITKRGRDDATRYL